MSEPLRKRVEDAQVAMAQGDEAVIAYMREEPPRPWCCPEPTCRPVYQHSENENLSRPVPGESFSCFGRMERPVVFEYDGVSHRNDLNSCHYTPLKGVIRWQENADDWALLAGMYAAALKALSGSQGQGK
jgi:hypothetical protein